MPSRTYESHLVRRQRYRDRMTRWPNAMAASWLEVSTRTITRYRRELNLPVLTPGMKVMG